MNDEPKNELINCIFFASLLFIVGSGLIAFHPNYSEVIRTNYLLIKILLILTTAIGWFVFRRAHRFGVVYLTWQAFILVGLLLCDTYGIFILLSTSSNDSWSGMVFILLLVIAMTLSFMVRISDPHSTFNRAIQVGRFEVCTYVFNTSAFLRIKPSKDNPILKTFGLNNSQGTDFEKTVRKSGFYSALVIGLSSILSSLGFIDIFYMSLCVIFTFCCGYVVFNNFVVDFYYCIKAGLIKKV